MCDFLDVVVVCGIDVWFCLVFVVFVWICVVVDCVGVCCVGWGIGGICVYDCCVDDVGGRNCGECVVFLGFGYD